MKAGLPVGSVVIVANAVEEQMAIYWDEAAQCFQVPTGCCPYPIGDDDGTVKQCVERGHCGCSERIWDPIISDKPE